MLFQDPDRRAELWAAGEDERGRRPNKGDRMQYYKAKKISRDGDVGAPTGLASPSRLA